MATLTTKLTLTGSATDFGAALSLSEQNGLTVTEPMEGIGQFDLAAGANKVISAAGSAGTVFCYVKNNNTSGSGTIQLARDTGSYEFGTLGNEEFAWIPIDNQVGIRIVGVTASVEVEYAFFTKS